jgi:hypothetical protein
MIKSSREVLKSRPPTIYKPPQRIEPLCSRWGLTRHHRMRRWVALDVALVSGRTTPSTPMDATCPCPNLHHTNFHSTARVHGRTGCVDGMHRTPQGQRPIDSSKVPERENVHRTRLLGGDRMQPSVRWSLGLATCLHHLHRTLTHCVRSPASATTQKCTGHAGVPRPVSTRSAPSLAPLPELTGCSTLRPLVMTRAFSACFSARNTTTTSPPLQPLLKCANHLVYHLVHVLAYFHKHF